jgi:hypothetical protein
MKRVSEMHDEESPRVRKGIFISVLRDEEPISPAMAYCQVVVSTSTMAGEVVVAVEADKEPLDVIPTDEMSRVIHSRTEQGELSDNDDGVSESKRNSLLGNR